MSVEMKNYLLNYYDYRQVNGQIHLTTKYLLQLPTHGPEICIKGLPKNTNAEDVFELFQSIGAIGKLRFLVDFEGQSRGICYIKYFDAEHCNQAIEQFNKMKFCGEKIKVFLSSNHRLLVLSNVDDDITDVNITELIQNNTYPDLIYIWKYNQAKHVLIRYYTHQDAIKYRRILCNLIHYLGAHVSIHWFKIP